MAVSICFAGDYDLQGRHVWSAEACSFGCSGLVAAACPLRGVGGGFFPHPYFSLGGLMMKGMALTMLFFVLLPFELLILLWTQCGHMQKQTGSHQ
jgi:uncharacterized membrane protein